MPQSPIFYSFRRCPYAMRARLAVAASGVETELREVVLRDKPASMLKASPKGTVPVLVLPDGRVIDESRDIMMWALEQHDPLNWLRPYRAAPQAVNAVLDQNDGAFKHQLDRYKYPGRYKDAGPPEAARDAGLEILKTWNERIALNGWILGDTCSIADMALRPFVRQFAHVDQDWFYEQKLSHLQSWLEEFLNSDIFQSIMKKYDQWTQGAPGIRFPAEQAPSV